MKKFATPDHTYLLLIENPDQPPTIRQALQADSTHYKITTAHSLSEARKHLSKPFPDFVITDLELQDGRGMELLSDADYPISCPLIVVAEETSRQEACQALRLGAHEYILKDVTPSYEIPRVVQRLVKEKNFVIEYKKTLHDLLESEKRTQSSYELIRLILKGTASKRKKDFLKSLVQHMALALKLPFAGIGKLNYPDKKDVTVQTFWNVDNFGEEFTYDLKNTPCDHVFKKEWFVYPDEVSKLFPKDQMLVDMGINSYMGIALFDAFEKPIGIIWVMDTKPFKDIQSMKEIMTIFAVRAETELAFSLIDKEHEKN
jgi:response regulator of citrate/malate metabolism